MEDHRQRREAAAADLSWRQLFEKLSEGFLVGELVRDADGRAVDWTYLDVNAAWGVLIGQPPASVIGRTVRDVLPEVGDAWIAEMAAVVETGRPHIFTRALAGRSFEGHAFHLEGDRFAAVFVESTARHRADARRAALLSLGDRIRDLDDPAAIAAVGAALVGEALGVSRAAFGRIDAAMGTIELDRGWTADGTEGLAGSYRFSDFGQLTDEMLDGAPLVIDDVRTDPRTAGDPAPLLALGIGALVNMPVRERGRTVAALVVHHPGARRWDGEEVAFLRNVADRVEVGVSRLEAERRQAMLNDELSHRLKNPPAMVQAIATQTLRRRSEADAFANFEKRLGALASAHEVLLGRGRDTAELGTLARGVIGAVAAVERVTCTGPTVMLGARAAVSAALLLHELCTNATKYGALSVEGGHVEVVWTVADDALSLDWCEKGGPPATPPTRKGFGSRLISAGLTGTGSVHLCYIETGFSANMRASLTELQSA